MRQSSAAFTFARGRSHRRQLFDLRLSEICGTARAVASVVFIRGVNVGGHKTFRPAVIARELAALDVVNVGAAGTFVIRKTVSLVRLREELKRRLAFEAEVMICGGREITDLVRSDPFRGYLSSDDVRPFVSVMAKASRALPKFPISRPIGENWQVKIIGVSGRCALSLWRRLNRTTIYPNEVVEKEFGVPATTRNWNTISTICEILSRKNG